MSKITPREVAEWLAQEATDEEFAEAFVIWSKIHKSAGKPVTTISTEDMRNADIDYICKITKEALSDILFSEDICESAWWKKAK